MKCCVLHVDTVKGDSTFPTVRITRFVADTLGLLHVYDADTATRALACGPYDVVIMKPGTWRYSHHKMEALKLCAQAKHIVIIENDYSWRLDPVFLTLGKPMHFWTTVRADVAGVQAKELNWNVLTWNYPDLYTCGVQQEWHITEKGIIYWGVFRGGRVDDFSRFFKHAPYRVTIGSNTFGIAKWLHFTDGEPQPRVMNLHPPQSEVIKRYEATIYMEDEATRQDTNFAQLSNRFYEAMEAGVFMFISARSAQSFLTAGFSRADIAPFIVNGRRELQAKMPYLPTLRALQSSWHRDYVTGLRANLVAAYADLENGV